MPEIVTRAVDEAAAARLVASGCDARLARLYAARGVHDASQLEMSFASLTAPSALTHADEAARLLADAIEKREKLLIVADYDADGATACAVGLRALRAFGADVDFLVPNRFRHGYGLTPEVVREAAARKPAWIITVDNGIAAVAGVDEAAKLGMRVLVTDHHLPGHSLPAAACIVNPNQAGCGFPSKNLAGVGVIFYVMMALRAELRARGAFASKPPPNLAHLLDIVALGTVADVVKLDSNNRVLVAQGLARIRAGKACAGIRALFDVAGRQPWRATPYDLAFVVGPRLNAAGRMDDMSLGIECLITDDVGRAKQLAGELDQLNQKRQSVGKEMEDSALAMLGTIEADDASPITVHHPSWTSGVVGILASRLREKFHRPAFAFASDDGQVLKGSGRSIPALHLRDALDLVDKRHPGLLVRFGGHAAAAGVTLDIGRLADFQAAFAGVVRGLLVPSDLDQTVETDGELAEADLSLEFARLLRDEVWGQGFPPPQYVGHFRVLRHSVVGEAHSKLLVECGGSRLDAIRFRTAEPPPDVMTATYRLEINEYQGRESLQLVVTHWE